MADQALGGTLAQGADLSLTCPSSSDVEVSTSANSNWTTAKAGDSLSTSAAGLVGAGLSGGTYTIYRTHILFNIPDNLIRLDLAPQLKIYVYNNLLHAATITSNAYSSPATPLSGLTETSLWDNVQTGAGALYKATSGTFSRNDDYNTIDLDANAVAGVSPGLAAYHCIIKAGTAMVISMINAEHDFANSAPSDNDNFLSFRPAGHANEPFLILREAWFKDGDGNAKKYEGDFIINAHDPNLDSHHKTVDQVPFGFNVRGPISLRNTGRAYRATKSN